MVVVSCWKLLRSSSNVDVEVRDCLLFAVIISMFGVLLDAFVFGGAVVDNI